MIKEVEVDAELLKTDNLQNFYTSKNANITKYSKKGIKLAEYSKNSLGNISSFDVLDPLRILVFYKDINQIVFLDNTLSEIGTSILLDNLEQYDIELVCSSFSGGFWVYNQQFMQLFYFDKNLQLKQKSSSISSVLSNNQKPTSIFQQSDYIYMNVPELGILIFDRFGAFYKIVHLKNIENFQVSEREIIYAQGKYIHKYNFETLLNDSTLLPSKEYKSLNIQYDKLYLLDNKHCSIFTQN